MPSLLLSIGSNSLNQPIVVDICSLPHFFVAYSYEAQLQHFLQHSITAINTGHTNGNALAIAIALSNSNVEVLQHIHCPVMQQLIPSITTDITQNSMHKDAFIAQLFQELKNRLKQQKQTKNAAASLPIIIIIIDELFSVILSQKKQTGMYFLQLLILGKQVGMHFIAASASTYRNLLLQLMHMHPEIEKQLSQKQFIKRTTIVKPLGAELVLTPDDLVFFKAIDMPVHERYFKW